VVLIDRDIDECSDEGMEEFGEGENNGELEKVLAVVMSAVNINQDDGDDGEDENHLESRTSSTEVVHVTIHQHPPTQTTASATWGNKLSESIVHEGKVAVA
jgi:hypothetical protein